MLKFDKKYLIILFVAAEIFLWFSVSGAQTDKKNIIYNLSPHAGYSLKQGVLNLQWSIAREQVLNDIVKFVVVIWSERNNSVHHFTIKGPVRQTRLSYKINKIRDVCTRHGIYYWKVTGYFKNGEETESKISFFRIDPVLTRIKNLSVANLPPYGIEFAYFHRLRTAEQREFTENVLTDLLFRSYSEIRFVFNQYEIFNLPLDFCEKVKILMLPGVGLDLSAKLKIIKSSVFNFYVRGGTAWSCASTSVAEKHSIFYFYYTGAELSFMPGAYLTLIGDYIPEYTMPYQTNTYKTLTFQGTGYRFGFRYIFSQKVMPLWNIGKLTIDMRRVPIEVLFETVKDDNLGTIIKTRKIKLGYFF